MALDNISPGRFKKILYDTPRKGKVELAIDASSAICVYVVDASDIERWKRGREYTGVSFRSRKQLDEVILLPDFGPAFYLVLENESDRPVAVHYEVYH